MAFTSNFKTFSQDYSGPVKQAWLTGKGPDEGTLGPNRKTDTDSGSFKNSFVSKLRDNPGYKNFYNGSVFSDDTAELSQQKINDKSKTPDALFKNPNDTDRANAFLTRYSEGVSRGLIEEEDAVTPDNLARLTGEPAAAGASEKDPNTVNKFPSQGVSI
jgi:hypothetical protein